MNEKNNAAIANNRDKRTGRVMKSKWQWSGMVGVALAISRPAVAEYAYTLQVPVNHMTGWASVE